VIYVASTASVLALFWRPLLRRMSAAGWRVIALTPRGPGWAGLDEPGIEHRPFAMARRIGAVASHTRSLAYLHRLYRNERPALVHHLTINPVIYGSLAARVAGVPSVVNTLPGLGAVFTSTRWDATALRTWTVMALRVAASLGESRFVVQNSADLDLLIKRRVVPANRAIVIRGSGVDLDRFSPLPEPDGEPTVLLAGRMLWSKGVGDLIAAARLVRARGRRLRLLLAGPADAAHRDAVSLAQLERWNSEGIATWLGMREDMPQLYAATHVVALPTRYGEGVPSVLVEAAASGRAIVASDTPGCREVVRHDHNGLLVRGGDIPALAAAVDRLLQDHTLRATMGRRGRDIAVAEFGLDRIIGSVEALYASLSAARDERRAA
jgi:glycosyltransferase involved in cell wall biosynthesis